MRLSGNRHNTGRPACGGRVGRAHQKRLMDSNALYCRILPAWKCTVNTPLSRFFIILSASNCNRTAKACKRPDRKGEGSLFIRGLARMEVLDSNLYDFHMICFLKILDLLNLRIRSYRWSQLAKETSKSSKKKSRCLTGERMCRDRIVETVESRKAPDCRWTDLKSKWNLLDSDFKLKTSGKSIFESRRAF